MQSFAALKQHLISHVDAHPIFNTPDPIQTDGLYKSFRVEVLSLPQAQAQAVINAIQAVRPTSCITLPRVVRI